MALSFTYFQANVITADGFCSSGTLLLISMMPVPRPDRDRSFVFRSPILLLLQLHHF